MSVTSMNPAGINVTMKKNYFAILLVMLSSLLAGCGGESGDSDAPSPQSGEVKLSVSTAMETVIPAEKTDIDLLQYVSSQGLQDLAITAATPVSNMGITADDCDAIEYTDTGLDVTLYDTGACELEYQVMGLSSTGQSYQETGQVLVVSSSEAVDQLAPITLTISGVESAPYTLDLDAAPVSLTSGENATLSSGAFSYPAGFTVAAETSVLGQGQAEGNPNDNTITFTPTDNQTGYTRVVYIVEDSANTTTYMGTIDYTISAGVSAITVTDETCSVDLFDAQTGVTIDVAHNISSPYKTTTQLIHAESLTAVVGVTDPGSLSNQSFDFASPTSEQNYVSYTVTDQHGGFATGQMLVQTPQPTNSPEGPDFIAVEAGFAHGYALDTEGNVWAVGDNSSGQLGLGDTDDRDKWTKTTLSNIQAISAGSIHGYALDNNVKVWSVGSNSDGQLGLGDVDDQTIWRETGLTNIKQISAGGDFGYALSNETNVNNVYVVGSNSDGQLGLANRWGAALDKTNTWVKTNKGDSLFANFKDIHTIVAGTDFGYAIGNGGANFAIGKNDKGQLGIGYSGESVKSWQYKTGIYSDIISAGGAHGYYYSNSLSLIKSTGDNSYGQLGRQYTWEPPFDDSWVPAHSGWGVEFTPASPDSLNAGLNHGLGIADNDGKKIVVVGRNTSGQLGLGDDNNREKWVYTTLTNAIAVAGGAGHSYAIIDDNDDGAGKIYSTGSNYNGALGRPDVGTGGGDFSTVWQPSTVDLSGSSTPTILPCTQISE